MESPYFSHVKERVRSHIAAKDASADHLERKMKEKSEMFKPSAHKAKKIINNTLKYPVNENTPAYNGSRSSDFLDHIDDCKEYDSNDFQPDWKPGITNNGSYADDADKLSDSSSNGKVIQNRYIFFFS